MSGSEQKNANLRRDLFFRNFIESVEDVGMPERRVVGRSEASELEVMNVAFDEPLDMEVNGEVVWGDGDFFNDRSGLIDFGAAVGALVNVGPSGGLVRGEVKGGSGINGLGERDHKAVGLGAHFVHFERGDAGPADAFESEGFPAASRPATIGPADKKGGVFAHTSGDDATAKSFEKPPSGALVEAIDFFKVDALDFGVGLFADEDLLGEWAKLSVGIFRDHGGGRLTDFAVWEDHGRWDDAGVFLTFNCQTGLVGWFGWRFESIDQSSVFVTVRISHKAPGFEPFEG